MLHIYFQEQLQFIVVPKIGKYRNVVSSDVDIHLEQIKVEDQKYKEDVQWLVCDRYAFIDIKYIVLQF